MIDLKELRHRISGAPNHQGVVGPTWINPNEAMKLIDMLESAQKDAARYRFLKSRMLGVDFDWNDHGITALSFEMPDGRAYGGDCDQNIDAAMDATKD